MNVNREMLALNDGTKVMTSIIFTLSDNDQASTFSITPNNKNFKTRQSIPSQIFSNKTEEV